MSHLIRISTLVTLLALGMTACADTESPSSPVPTDAVADMRPAHAGVNADLAAARAATAHLQQFENADPAGWDVPVTGCMDNPPLGGMGYHFGNLAFYFDGAVDPAEPEILLYEPQPNGRLRLVALEYAVPFEGWGTGDPDVDDPPQLFGRNLNRADARHQWELHVWLWKHNPSGMFEDWNPNVSCEHASE